MLFAAVSCGAVSAAKTFHVEKRWVVGGAGGWDYLAADPANHRLYLTHTDRVEVLDTRTGKVVGQIAGLTRTHGVALIPGSTSGFITDGGANQVVAFETTTLAATAHIPAGTNPDGIAYEPMTKTVWAFNGRSSDVTAIDAVLKKPVGTIPLPGKPEFPQADGKGNIFVNIEDKNEIVRLDAKTMKITATWPLAGCSSPSGMAIDRAGMRLFSVCNGEKMVVTDATTGSNLATPPIGDGPDAAGYDAKRKLAFSSNGEGTLTIVDAEKAGYPVLQTVATEKGARTMCFDPGDGKVYLVTAKFAPVDPATPKARPTPLAGSFVVLVVGR
ncbi:YncE family protein [Acidipila sp. EB88]|nr:YncE family protein [Acidipila sp. EB88]